MAASGTVNVESVGWLERKLMSAARKYYAAEFSAFVLTCVSVFLLAMIIYFAADYMVSFPSVIRGLLTAGITVGGIFAIKKIARKRLVRVDTPDAMARLVEGALDKSGMSQHSIIISALEFGNNMKIMGANTLKNSVIRSARNDCVDPVLVKLNNPQHAKRALWMSLTAALLTAAWVWLLFPYFTTFLARMVMLNPRYPTATRIVSYNWSNVAPMRRDYPLAVKVAGKIPAIGTMTVKVEGRKAYELEMLPGGEGDVFAATIPVPDRPFWFKFAIGDYVSDKHRVKLLVPPSVEQGRIVIAPPAYTGLSGKEVNLGSTSVQEGSTLTFSVTPSKPLETCALAFTNRTVEMRESGGTYSAEVAISESGTYELVMKDTEGLENSDRASYYLNVIADNPPKINIIRPQDNSLISDLSVLQLDSEITDDFGLKSAVLAYDVFITKGENEQETEEKVRGGEVPLDVRQGVKTDRVRLVKQMTELKAQAGERFEFRVIAKDNRMAGDVAGQSEPVSVSVVSAEELRATIQLEQDRMADLLRKLREDERKHAEAIRKRLLTSRKGP